jgi:hypothetical protein
VLYACWPYKQKEEITLQINKINFVRWGVELILLQTEPVQSYFPRVSVRRVGAKLNFTLCSISSKILIQVCFLNNLMISILPIINVIADAINIIAKR